MLIFLISAEDLPLAPSFTTTTTGYDPPSFYGNSADGPSGGSRIYGDGYRDQEIYPGDPGYQRQNSYSLYPGSNGLSVDLPSPDSGIGPDQVADQVCQPTVGQHHCTGKMIRRGLWGIVWTYQFCQVTEFWYKDDSISLLSPLQRSLTRLNCDQSICGILRFTSILSVDSSAGHFLVLDNGPYHCHNAQIVSHIMVITTLHRELKISKIP